MVSTYCPNSPVLQEEIFALHKLGIHMRAVVDVSILDEYDSDDDMMRFKDNEEDAEKLTGSSLISLGHVYHLTSRNPHREPSTRALVAVESDVSQWCQHVVLIHGIAGRKVCFA